MKNRIIRLVMFRPQKQLTYLPTLLAILLMPGIMCAQNWKLIGLTGMNNDAAVNEQFQFVNPDRTLFEISLVNGAATRLFQATFILEGHVIGYCPTNGLIYHAAGGESWNNNPVRVGNNQGVPDLFGAGYQDCQYLETINLATHEFNAIYNANPCPNPDATLPCFGLTAPRPSWVEPVVRRDSTEAGLDATNRVRGVNEFHEARGLAWSTNKNLFYVSDEQGIFKLTTTGECTFLARPAFTNADAASNSRAKGIAFVNVGGVTKLLAGHRDGAGTNGYIMEIDPETGAHIGEIAVKFPPGGGLPEGEFGGLMGLAQHPVTGVIYGVRKGADNLARELVTINLSTGDTTLVGNMGQHITSIAFVSSTPPPPVRFIGLTGMNNDAAVNEQFQFVNPDRTLFEISLVNGAATRLFQATFILEGHVIGYCPTNGLIYHAAGGESWNNNPVRVGNNQGVPDLFGAGYQDCQYLETINLATHEFNAIYNANPCPNPDATLPCFGLTAPRPSWVEPVVRRDSTEAGLDATNRVRGVNEFHEARGLAWSTNKNLFYVSDEQGIFKLTTTGECTFLARPAFTNADAASNSRAKGIAFVNVGGVTKLLAGHRDGAGTNGYIMEIDPETGAHIGEIAVKFPPGGGLPEGEFGGLMGLAQHPVTGVIYGVRKGADNLARELVTINLSTGDTTLVGNMGQHITSIAFVPPVHIESITRSGNDLTITWSGGIPPYQLQTRPSLSGGSWSNVGGPTTQNSATVINGVAGSAGFFRVASQ